MSQEDVMTRNIRIWKTITYGGMKKRELFEKLKRKGIRYDLAIPKIPFVFPRKGRTIHLAREKPRTLGFTEKPTGQEFWRKIVEIGNLCPKEAGLSLGLQFEDQDYGDFISIAMDPISYRQFNLPAVLAISKSGGGIQELQMHIVLPEVPWGLDADIIFALRA